MKSIQYSTLAALVAVMAGGSTVAANTPGSNRPVSVMKSVGVMAGMSRAREPRQGDYWRGCKDARAAGTAPIYAGEPGYRVEMDGDGDGIACEPYRN